MWGYTTTDYSTKKVRTYNGEKTVSSIGGVGKAGQSCVDQ